MPPNARRASPTGSHGVVHKQYIVLYEIGRIFSDSARVVGFKECVVPRIDNESLYSSMAFVV